MVRYVWYGAPRFDGELRDLIVKTSVELEAAVKRKIVEYGAVDTGNLLNTTFGSTDGAYEARVDSPAPYALYVDRGHRVVAWGVDQHWYYPGRPFMEDGVAEHVPAFVAALEDIAH